jgi:hypothetical protein
MTTVHELIPVLQTAIGPMILISGIGLLMLSMSNRLGRIIDRSRVLSNDLLTDQDKIEKELAILWKRAKTLRKSIALLLSSALCAAILIIMIFFTALFQLETAWLLVTLFTIGMCCVITSLSLYIYDINMSLAAIKLEMPANIIRKK